MWWLWKPVSVSSACAALATALNTAGHVRPHLMLHVLHEAEEAQLLMWLKVTHPEVPMLDC